MDARCYRWFLEHRPADGDPDVADTLAIALYDHAISDARTVLWLRLPNDQADPHRLSPGLWAGGTVPFNAGFWPGPIAS